MDVGNVRTGSVIHGPGSLKALKKLGAIRGSLFFARVRRGKGRETRCPLQTRRFSAQQATAWELSLKRDPRQSVSTFAG
jgi:hypothetical protein